MPTPWLTAAGGLLLTGLLTAWIPHPAVRAAFCLSASALACAWLADALRRRRRLVFPTAWIVLAAICGWMAVQPLLVPSPAPRAAAQEFATWTAAALLTFLLLNEIDCSRLVATAVLALTTAGGLLAAWALVQGLTSHGKVLWTWSPGIPIERVWGPFLYHNKLAQFAELILPAAICLAVADHRRRWLWLTCAASLLSVTIVAASRAGVVLLCLEVCLCAALLIGWRVLSARQAALAAAQLLLVAGSTVLIAGWETFRDRFAVRQMLEDHRFDLNRSSWEMAKVHMPLGAGYGAWPVVYPEFATFDDGRFANQAHNDWLQWLAEGGVPGAAGVAVFLLLAAPALLRSVWGCGVIVVFLHAGVDYPFHQSPPLAALILSVALVAAQDNGHWVRRAAPLRARWVSVGPVSRHHDPECPAQNV